MSSARRSCRPRGSRTHSRSRYRRTRHTCSPSSSEPARRSPGASPRNVVSPGPRSSCRPGERCELLSPGSRNRNAATRAPVRSASRSRPAMPTRTGHGDAGGPPAPQPPARRSTSSAPVWGPAASPAGSGPADPWWRDKGTACKNPDRSAATPPTPPPRRHRPGRDAHRSRTPPPSGD